MERASTLQPCAADLRAARPRGRRPCRRCGGAKEPGAGRNICATCAIGTTVPAAERVKMARLYIGAGLSLEQIATRTYWSPNAVRGALLAEGVELRRPGWVAGEEHPRTLSEGEVLRAVELYLSGLSHAQIAQRLGFRSECSVRLRLQRAGIDARPKSEVFWLRRLSDVAERGVDAMTPMQRAAFLVVDAVRPDHVSTPEIAEQTGDQVRSVKVTMRRLERMGLVQGHRLKVTKNRPKVWRRTDLALVDVLRHALNPRRTKPAGDVMLPVAPIREWITDLVAAERRKTMAPIYTVNDRRERPAETENTGEVERVATRLGLNTRRMHALCNQQATVSLSIADEILTVSGGPRLEELWPQLADDVAA